ASGSPSELARHDKVFSDDGQASGVLAERRPPWLSGLAETLMAKSVRHWPLCYRLVMAGLCQRPTSENWCLGFLAHGKDPDQHLSDPVFAERELWRLFEIEGTSDLSFTNVERWRGPAWATALRARGGTGAAALPPDGHPGRGGARARRGGRAGARDRRRHQARRQERPRVRRADARPRAGHGGDLAAAVARLAGRAVGPGPRGAH